MLYYPYAVIMVNNHEGDMGQAQLNTYNAWIENGCNNQATADLITLVLKAPARPRLEVTTIRAARCKGRS